ncbi:Fic family protein [Oceanivirga salmonicida]|uniref:Fic family protein n=1 Tax=Oceanivirga salmonicida TaxID=1769291 RepID=UPI0012E21B0A|nr:Fic/DOC family N-terminal domain-containing protein [Oceanivirga salmonicida]
MKLKNNRAGNLKYMNTGYTTYIPNKLSNINIEIDNKMNLLLNKAYLLLGRLDGIAITLPDIDLFVSMYIQKEATLSSQIEGTQASLIDVLQKERLENNKNNIKETEEIVNYIKATKFAFEKLKELPLCMRLLKEVHKVLLYNTRGSEKELGEFRNSQNWIGYTGCNLNTATYIPPAVEYMTKALYELEEYINNESNIPNIIKIALIHYQFETIHPFLDGNGRIGRLLIILFLKEVGLINYPVLYLSYYFKKNRSEYYDLLMKVRFEGKYEEFIKFFITGIIEVCKDSLKSIQDILELKKQDIEKINAIGKGNILNLLKIYEYSLKHPFLNSKDLKNEFDISKPTINKLLDILLDLGIFELVDKDKKRYKEYVYRKYVNILSEGTDVD